MLWINLVFSQYSSFYEFARALLNRKGESKMGFYIIFILVEAKKKTAIVDTVDWSQLHCKFLPRENYGEWELWGLCWENHSY